MELIKVIERNKKEYVSTIYLESVGLKVNPLASLSEINIPIFDEFGNMEDLLIPLEQLEANLYIDNIQNKAKKPVHTYIIKDTASLQFKIGKSTNIEKRIKLFSTSNPNLELILIIEKNIEKELHLLFRERRYKGEWFKLTDSDLKFIKFNYSK